MDFSEAELIRDGLRGDRRAFDALFAPYRTPLFRLALRFVGSPDDAEDLTQAIFVRAFERLASFRGESAFSTWLYRLAIRTASDFLRRSRKAASSEIPESLPDPAPSPEARTLRSEREGRIRRCVSSLPEAEKVAFLLVALEGMTYAEAARILGATESAVRMRVCRGRNELRRRLSAEPSGAAEGGEG